MAGFQLSIRSLTDGGQAGELYPAAGQQKISSADVLYLTHTEPSVISQAGVTWDISWTAPEGVPVPVVLHAAAVAGNDDESPLGDSVHLLIQKLDHSDGLQQENP